jgi:predicted RND superfamily exporter protein
MLSHLPLFLNDQELETLADKLSDRAIEQQVQANRQLLLAPLGIASKEIILRDPLALRDVIADRRNEIDTPKRSSLMPGFYGSADGRMSFLIITPREPPQNIAFSKRLMQAVRACEQAALKEAEARLAGFSGTTQIHYTGGYPIAINDEAMTKKDIQITLLTSFLGVMLLFGLAFRTARILVYIGLPLICSLLWTVGLAAVVFGRLNILTCIFACVLIGLGVDFAIHVVNRYFDPQNTPLVPVDRLARTFGEAGTGIVVGGLTTAAAFFAVAVSDFRGFRELGFMTGSGILFGMVAMLLLLPALLVLGDGHLRGQKPISIAGFGLQPFLGVLQRYPRRLLVVTGVLAVGLSGAGFRVGFDDNLKNFRARDDETLYLQERVTNWFGGSTGSVLLVNRGATENQVLQASALTYEALQELVRAGHIAGIRSLSQYLPAPEQQRRHLDFVRRHRSLFDIERIRKTFSEAMQGHGFRVAGLYDAYFESLALAFSTDAIILPSRLQVEGLQNVLKPFVIGSGDHLRMITYIRPSRDLWLRNDVRQFKAMIARKLEDKGLAADRYFLTGVNLLTGDLKDLILNNLKTSLGLAGISILVVLLLYYRNVSDLMLSLLPLMVGLAVLSGLMALMRIDYNFLNIMILPMIVGIGLDDGVHFTNTYRQSNAADRPLAIYRTGRAVVLTSLTTLVGFGSIALSHYPGLQSMGYVSVLGIGACLAASLIVLPAVFEILSASGSSTAPQARKPR